MRILLLLVTSLSLALPAPLLAYGDGNYSGLSRSTTTKVVRLLTGGVQNCQKLGKPYRYDCYRATYGAAATALNGNPAYKEARDVLLEVEQSLGNTISRNLDNAQPKARLGLQRFRAIKPAAIPGAKKAFIATLDKAETKLLRSGGDGGEHFIRIAEALNTNKVLLRSALLLAPLNAAMQLAGWAWATTAPHQAVRAEG